MSRTARAALAGSLAVAVGFVDLAGAAAGDQAAADAAITAFNERMLDAGWTSHGRSDAEADQAEIDLWRDCIGDYVDLMSSTEGNRAEGETGRAASDDFRFGTMADVTAPSASEPPWEAGDFLEFAAAGVLTVDDTHRDMVDGLVEELGSPDTARCLQERLARQFPRVLADSGGAMTDLTAVAHADLRIGDASSRIEYEIEFEFEGDPYSSTASVSAARTDRTLVYIGYGGVNVPPDERASGFDADAELEALVDSLDG